MATIPLTRRDGDAHHKVTITLEDAEIVFSDLALNERLADTNQFSFTWKNELNDGFTDDQESFIEQYIGKRIVISINDDTHTFVGIITSISFYKNDGLTQEFTVSGQSPAVLLDDKPIAASYYKQTLRDIISECVKGLSSNELSIDNNPNRNDLLFYIVQNNETDFNFIKNLAIRTGEWFFFNGEKLKFGPITGNSIDVRIGSELFDAKVSAVIKPFLQRMVSYDDFKGTVIKTKDNEPAASGLLNILLKGSEQTFSRGPSKPTYAGHQPTAAKLDALLESDSEGRIARMTMFSAKSHMPSIKLGSKIKVHSGNKTFEYIVVHIQHIISARDSYMNSFQAVPSSIKVPPYTNRSWFPVCGSQSAIVKENEDKDGLDRVKVKFPWQAENEMSPWIKVQSPYAGEGKGFRFIPEIGEEVIVGFEGNNAERPFVIGAMYSGAGKSAHSHEGNHIKIFRTASGCRLMMNDKDGSAKLVDKAGSYIKLDGTGNITISASGDLKIQIGGKSDIEIGKDSNYTVGQKLTESIGSDKSTTVGANEDKVVGQNLSIQVAQDLTIQAGQNYTLEAGMDIEETAGMNIKNTGGVEVSVEGGVGVKIKGGATAEMASPMTTVKGDAMTTIKGGMVMIN